MTLARYRAFASWLPTVVACILLAYRFANRDLVPFILDEPQFIEAARAQLTTGVWADFSPLIGNQGLHYGPTPLWFYGLVHMLFGSKPTTHIFAMATCMTVAHGFLAVQLGRHFDRSLMLPAVLVSWVAASPYQFFWSRLAWDQSVNVTSSLVVALLCTRGRIGWRRGAAIGALLGFALGSHLMVAPFAALVFAFLAHQAVRRRSIAALFLAVAAAAIACGPYLRYFITAAGAATPAGVPIAWPAVSQFLLEPVRVATTQGIEYFFDQQWSQFNQERGPSLVSWLGSPTAVVVLAGCVALGLGLTVWIDRGARARIAWLAILTWLGYACFYAQRGLPPHPHYQFPTWWIVLVGVAGLFHELRRRAPGGARWLLFGTTALIVVEVVFLVSWMHFVRRHGGTSGVHYGATIAEQTSAVRQICRVPDDTIEVANETNVFENSLSYIAETEPACSGKHLRFLRSYGRPPAHSPTAPVLRYREAGSAFLTVD